MSHLAKLKLNERTRADVKQTPEQRLRAKLVDHLKLQKEIAEADLKGELINKTRLKFVRDEATGETRRIEVPKLVRRWWWKDKHDAVLLQLRYGSRPIAVSGKNSTIEVGQESDIPNVIDTVIDAVNAGELDKPLKAALGERRLKLRQVK
jgi:hypothetical protein